MKSLFLVGFMGSGKSTEGRKLARALSVDFFDLDDVIENLHHQTIPELFNSLGESKFREIERDALRTFGKKENPFVMATGGGTPCFFGNMEWMKRQGEVLFLDIPERELIK